VDQVQIEHVEAELLHAGVERPQRRVVALVGVPQLGGDEQLVARDVGGGDRLAHLGLVAVDRRGVDVAVAELERLRDRVRRVGRRDLEDTEAELRDRDAVGERQRGDLDLAHRDGIVAERVVPRRCGLVTTAQRHLLRADRHDARGARQAAQDATGGVAVGARSRISGISCGYPTPLAQLTR
jgi:hypothetical protein